MSHIHSETNYRTQHLIIKYKWPIVIIVCLATFVISYMYNLSERNDRNIPSSVPKYMQFLAHEQDRELALIEAASNASMVAVFLFLLSYLILKRTQSHSYNSNSNIQVKDNRNSKSGSTPIKLA